MKIPVLLPNIFNYPFTYETDLRIDMGDFVEVPFGKSKIVGVVWDNFEKKNDKNFKIKKVINKLEIPSLKKSTIQFLNWFSDYNIVPRGMALKLVLLSGKPVKLFEEKIYKSFNFNIIDNSIKLTFEQKKLWNK